MPFSETSKRWLVWLAVVVVILAARTGWILYQRGQPVSSKRTAPKLTEKDYLTVIPKSGAVDLESTRELIGKKLWVRAGYLAEYSAYGPSPQSAAPSSSKLFEPMEEISVRNIIERPMTSHNKQKEVLLLFARENEMFAAVIGYFDPQANQYQMQLDDLFYVQDPHAIFRHWDESTWQKINHHQLEPQMTFAQVNLSLGVGTLVTMEAGGSQLYQFSRKPGGATGKTRVRFLDGRVKEFDVVH